MRNVILTNNLNQESIDIFITPNQKNRKLFAYEVDITKTISADPKSRGNTKELLLSTFEIEHIKLKNINLPEKLLNQIQHSMKHRLNKLHPLQSKLHHQMN